jgi:hypothetical protein
MATIWVAPLRGKVSLGRSVLDQFKDHLVSFGTTACPSVLEHFPAERLGRSCIVIAINFIKVQFQER